jgi:hypothetical protein
LFFIGVRNSFEFFTSSLILLYGEVFVFPAVYLSSASYSDFFLSYLARSDSYLVQASLCFLARRLRPSFNLFFLFLAHFWFSVSPSYSRALGDMLDSDSSEDLSSWWDQWWSPNHEYFSGVNCACVIRVAEDLGGSFGITDCIPLLVR